MLLISGDDLGLSPPINDGILEARNNGLLRSASLLVGMPSSSDGLNRATAAGIEVGLHLNMTTGTCQADPKDIPLLANADGSFIFQTMPIPKAVGWLRNQVDVHDDFLSQVRQEASAQLGAMARIGGRPLFLNTHHYFASIHPGLAKVTLQIAKEWSIPSRGHSWPIVGNMGLNPAQYDDLISLWAKNIVPTPDVSVTNLVEMTDHHMSPQDYEKVFIQTLEHLTREENPNTVELVLHPTNPRNATTDDYYWARQLETTLVLSQDLRRCVDQLGYRLATFCELGAQK